MSNTPSTTSSANIYGVCMATTVNGGSIDIAPGVLATGNDVLAQSLGRRQMTPQGSDPSAPNDGIVRAPLQTGVEPPCRLGKTSSKHRKVGVCEPHSVVIRRLLRCSHDLVTNEIDLHDRAVHLPQAA